MKKYLLIVLLVSVAFLCRSQTKGTSTVGLGLNFQTNKNDSPDYYSENSNATYSFGYGYFLKENQKAGLTVFIGRHKGLDVFKGTGGITGEPLVSWSYGGRFNYQKYYPLLKKFYAFAGARTGYDFIEQRFEQNDRPLNRYSAGVHGGVSWILFKRLALEADLLSADIVHSKSKSGYGSRIRSTKFDLSTAGPVNNLGFKIYYMF